MFALVLSACTEVDASEDNNFPKDNDDNEKVEIEYNEIKFINIEGSFNIDEVVLTIYLENIDHLEVNSLLINGVIYTDFVYNNDYSILTVYLNEGIYIGNKDYYLEKINYSFEELELEEELNENNHTEVEISLFINGYEFMQIPQFPINFVRISAGYRCDDYYNQFGKVHNGVDFVGANSNVGDKIYSIGDGEIVYVGNSSTAGRYVVIKHDNLIKGQTVITRYLHLDSYNVRKGDTVSKGEFIGYEGNTGFSTGKHLHFDMWIAPSNYNYNYYDLTRYVVNPIDYLYLHEHQVLSTRSQLYNLIMFY